MKHNDHPDNFEKVLKEIAKKTNKLFPLIERYALMNVESNYELWPSYVFLPIVLWMRVLYETEFKDFKSDKERAQFAQDMQSLFGFKYSKDKYVFDQTLINSLLKTPINTINAKALVRLPNQVLFVDVKGKLKINNKDVEGFYVYYNDDLPMERLLNFQNVDPELREEMQKIPPMLCIRVLWDDEEKNNVFHCAIPLIDGDLLTLLKEMKDARDSISIKEGFVPLENEVTIHECKNVIATLLPLILYLCSEEPDIINKKHPKLKHKAYYDKDKPKRIFSPPVMRSWEVGKVIGKTIRSQALFYKNSSVTPHLRRAHWHGFYTGKRNSEERALIYKWIPPIFVNPQEDKSA